MKINDVILHYVLQKFSVNETKLIEEIINNHLLKKNKIKKLKFQNISFVRDYHILREVLLIMNKIKRMKCENIILEELILNGITIE